MVEKHCSVGMYLPIHYFTSIYAKQRSFAKLSPPPQKGEGKSKGTREIRSSWMGKARENCHRGLRENRGLPPFSLSLTLVECTRVSKRSGSSLTKEEVGRDARRNSANRWWGKSLQLVPRFVARSMKLATRIAVKFVNTVPFARPSR